MGSPAAETQPALDNPERPHLWRAIRRQLKRFKRFVVYLLVRLVVMICNGLPTRWVLRFGRFVGRRVQSLAYKASPRSLDNMQSILHLDLVEVRKMNQQLFEHFGCLAAELAILPRLLNEPGRIEWDPGAQDTLRKALSEERGVVFISAHLGNWELLAHAVARAGFDCATVARRSTNMRVGRWLERRREVSGLSTIRRRDPAAARQILTALKANKVVGILVDQNTRVESVETTFMGRRADTPSIAASLAIRGTPAVFGYIARGPLDTHRIVMKRIVVESTSASKKERIREAAQDFNNAIEAAIREHPEQWTWFHDRWKATDT